MEYVSVSGIVKAATAKAVLVEVNEVDGSPFDGEEVWFPLSQCEDLEGSEKGDEVEFDCPEWLAEEKELA
jgi:hypothetical protein